MRKLLASILALGCLTACTPDGSRATAASNHRNIVFVLTDDLALNLVPYLPHVRELAAKGTSFSDFTVTDSLCCPSRSSIFTGKFPHNTGVFTNSGPDGGFPTFEKRGNESSTFATDLQQAGYRTAFLGKYLNLYHPKDKHVPPGWTSWYGAGDAYGEFNYTLLENDQLKHYGAKPEDYLTDVVSAKASSFITESAAAGKPFLVEVATFAPHAPYTPAPRDKDSFPDVTAPRGPSFGKVPTDATGWLAGHPPLSDADITTIDADFRKRVQAVQAVDRMIADLETTLDKAGVADRTVVVFGSDNGYHMGEHGLNPGKQTAFDTDVNVPLVAAGPGIRAGATVGVPAENIDLRPTFDELAGVTPAAEVDGRSLVPLLSGAAPAWRDVALVEHHGPGTDPADPDKQSSKSGTPPTYQAIRTPAFTYVEYTTGEREYYDNAKDPDQLHNVASTLTADRLAQLHHTVQTMTACRGETCRTADRS
ncbi:sulfatase [Actinoplanes sp. N902-109]|uniref:sulfatase family protein n=1 Tax=Actinoplanes sp. (strain N902-109) TaxID=649831 RepID=UPI0012FCB510|nr:sulfatase [Actinoplanes sp. N902-109]